MLSKEDNEFFEEGSAIIYDSLPFEDKVKLHRELLDEGFLTIEDLTPVSERFFRLLHFLDVNYVKPADWTRETIEIIKKFSRKEMGQDSFLKVELKKELYLQDIGQLLGQTKPKEAFSTALLEMKLSDKYQKYLSNKVEGKQFYEST